MEQKPLTPDGPNDLQIETSERNSVLVNALGGGARIRILSALLGEYDRDLNVTEIAALADVDDATVYRHLDSLRAWGFVEKTRDVGNSSLYQIDTDSDVVERFARLEHALIEQLAAKETADELGADGWPIVAADE